MKSKLIPIIIILTTALTTPTQAENRWALSYSPLHFQEVDNHTNFGWIGMGVGVDIDQKWALNLSWELNTEVFFTMEVPIRDTIRLASALTLEFLRTFSNPKFINLNYQLGLNAGTGVTRIDAYKFADGAVTYNERVVSQEWINRVSKRRAFIGVTIGATIEEGVFELNYRPKLYGIGRENILIHSTALTLWFLR